MTAQRRTVLLFATLWAMLAFAQYARTAVVCIGVDRSAATLLLWAGQLALLTMPLALCARRKNASFPRETGGDVALILLAYVPATIALRIAETCAGQ